MDLNGYLDRIRFEGTPRPDHETLVALHRQHLLNITFENINVQLQRPVSLAVAPIYEKIVEQGRGGWCYEMNGLLEWALREIGFEVTRSNGGVMRSERGNDALGNHLLLLVQLGEPWIADVGFGDGMFEPVPLREGEFEQRGFRYGLEKLDDGFWRFHNHQHGAAPSYDFKAQPADESLFQEKCELLQSSPESPFVMTMVCQRFTETGYEVQLGKVARTVTPDGINSRNLSSAGEFIDRLREDFKLDVPEVADLWPRILDRHEQLFANGPS